MRNLSQVVAARGQLKCDVTRAETRFCLSAKRTTPIKWTGASVQSTTGSRGVRISDSNAGYTMFRGSVKGTGYPIRSPFSPSILLPCVTVCHHILTGLYHLTTWVFPGGKVAGAWRWTPTHLAPKLKNEYSYTSTPSLGLRGLFYGEVYVLPLPLPPDDMLLSETDIFGNTLFAVPTGTKASETDSLFLRSQIGCSSRSMTCY